MTGHPAGPPMAECALPEMFGNKAVKSPDLVLVTGAEGVLGGSLFYDLLRAEFNIRCLLKFEDEGKIDRKPGVEFFYCDPLTGDIPESAFDGVRYVVNIASPLNSGSLPTEDREATERLNNILITRTKSKPISRYVSLSSINVAEVTGTDDVWPGIAWHLEYSIINSGVPYTIFRSGVLLGESNRIALGIIASSGGPFSFLGKKGGAFYITPVKMLTEAVARALKTDQALNKTYNVTLDNPVGRKEIAKLLPSAAKQRGERLWETDTQVRLASAIHSNSAHSVAELEILPKDFEGSAPIA